jgi:hypothetical protein
MNLGSRVNARLHRRFLQQRLSNWPIKALLSSLRMIVAPATKSLNVDGLPHAMRLHPK